SDLARAPAPHDAVNLLAHLHVVGADRASDLADLERPRRLEERNVPGIDIGIVDADGRAIEVPKLAGPMSHADGARREDPDVLNRPSFQHPVQVPLALAVPPGPVDLVI